MTQELATRQDKGQDQAAVWEKVVIGGDLKDLSPSERIRYYGDFCNAVGVDPRTRPFSYLYLNNKLVLYALKDCTEQLRNNRRISIDKPTSEVIDDVYVVSVTAHMPDGRTDSDIGAVNIAGVKGDAKANAMMKALTKGKRRVTLSICGLGIPDESELETIPNARVVTVTETGEIVEPLPAPKKAVALSETVEDIDGPAPIRPTAMTPAPEVVATRQRIMGLVKELGRSMDAKLLAYFAQTEGCPWQDATLEQLTHFEGHVADLLAKKAEK
jgi:hypothetical protein